MSERKIFSVGYPFPGGIAEQIPYDSDRSLLDADIVVFEPTIEYYSADEWYQGKPSLSEHSSFAVRQHSVHWHSELKAAVECGKTILLFLAKPEVVFVDTGQRQYSGTGRNRQTTRIVTELSSYEAVPVDLEVQARSGEEIAAVGDLKYLASYWKEFGAQSPYESTISGKVTERLLRTRTGNRTVGAVLRFGRGTILLLPPLRYDEDDFTKYGDNKEPNTWNAKAQRFGKKLAGILAGLDRVIRSASEETPPPDWVQDDLYRFSEESEIESKIQRKTKQISSAQEQKRKLEQSLREAGRLRALLFEKGKPLERSILEALEILGFSVDRFQDEESEFDAVFSSQEGRFLGEAEGKDNKAVNIDKLSQLERNLQEDFAREDIDEFAQGVLFGNAFRLTPVTDRADCFTTKCISGAIRGGIALVRTPDLFIAAKHVRETGDAAYAQACRLALSAAAGKLAEFPPVPSAPTVELASDDSE